MCSSKPIKICYGTVTSLVVFRILKQVPNLWDGPAKDLIEIYLSQLDLAGKEPRSSEEGGEGYIIQGYQPQKASQYLTAGTLGHRESQVSCSSTSACLFTCLEMNLRDRKPSMIFQNLSAPYLSRS